MLSDAVFLDQIQPGRAWLLWICSFCFNYTFYKIHSKFKNL